MRRRRGIMGLNGGAGIPVIAATATGNPMTFETDMIKPLKSLVIPFTPIQEGSGDPSPDNVRQITGWTGIDIKLVGKNLTPPLSNTTFWDTKGYLNTSGDIVLGSTYRVCSKYFPAIAGKQYIFSLAGATWRGIAFYNANKEIVAFTQGTNTRTLTAPSTASYYRVYVDVSATNIQLEVGETATTYEPYQSTTLPINWQTEAGTIYGGTLTLNEDGSADLVVEKGAVTLDGTNIAGHNQTGCVVTANNVLKEMANSDIGEYISDRFKAHINSGTTNMNNEFTVDAYGRIVIRAPSLFSNGDETEANAYFAENPTTIVGLLPSSLTYHFDNIGQLITFVGTNIIWTDTNGTNIATYLKHQS